MPSNVLGTRRLCSSLADSLQRKTVWKEHARASRPVQDGRREGNDAGAARIARPHACSLSTHCMPGTWPSVSESVTCNLEPLCH